MRRLIFLIALSTVFFAQAEQELRPHERFWQSHWQTYPPGTIADRDAQDRKQVRAHIRSKRYKSLLDVGCGHCFDYFLFKRSRIPIEYCGVDISEDVIAAAHEQGINAVQGLIDDLPFEDSQFDVVMVRRVLECLDCCEPALDELIRVARKEVIVMFYLSLSEKPEHKVYKHMDKEGGLTYVNHYSKIALAHYFDAHGKVAHFSFESVRKEAHKTILHIFLK